MIRFFFLKKRKKKKKKKNINKIFKTLQEEEGEDFTDDFPERRVGFAASELDVDEEMEKKTPLRRRDTPHHKKGKRIVITDEAKDKVLQILAQTAKKEDEEVIGLIN